MIRSPAARIWTIAAIALGLFAAAWASIALTRHANVVAPLWPVDALLAAFLLRWSKTRAERIALLVCAAVGIAAADLLGGSPPLIALVMATLNLIDALVAEATVRRFGDPLDGLASFGAFGLIAIVLTPALTGVVAAAVASGLGRAAEAGHIALRWTLSAGLGMAIVGVFALNVRLSRWNEPALVWLRFAAVQAAAGAGVAAVLFIAPTPPLFLIPPLLVLGTLSHHEIGGVTSVMVAAVLVWLAAVTGHGPAVIAVLASADKIQLVQVFLAAMVFTVLPVSALLRRLDAYALELDARRIRAEQRSAIRTRLLAHVSHEIRSPLSGVTGLAELLRDGALGQLTPEQRETLAQILSTGAEVDQLARDLTDALALESGNARIHLAPVHVGEAVRSAVNLAGFRMSQHAAELQLSSADAYGLRVAADPLRLRQILVNLLVNAAKYGGRPPLVRITAVETGCGTVRFEVADNGPGVPADRREAMFGEFERLGAEESDLEGHGLGLALSQQIAKLLNGSMGVGDSDLGGALFWVELPLWRTEAAAA